jgi:hypothetical protein
MHLMAAERELLLVVAEGNSNNNSKNYSSIQSLETILLVNNDALILCY